jgi:hypothetical protein
MAAVTIAFERAEAEELIEALDAARARAMEAADSAQHRHDEDGRMECCEEAAILGVAYNRLLGALRDS